MYYEQPQGVSVHEGFPNAAADGRLQTLDLNQLLIRNRISTYFFAIKGNHWVAYGIFNDDIAIVDRALAPTQNDLVAWHQYDDLQISYMSKLPKSAEVWGVISSIIHSYRPRDIKT